MTTIAISTGASSAYDQTSWQSLPWPKIKAQVFRLQMRIAKATREGKKGKVRALQRILTHSFYGKCIAVKRVTSNRGSKTPGIDGILWRTNLQKIKAISEIKSRGYKPLPLKRIYIPKKQKSKFRALSIPCLKDRAMQTLWQLALQPIAEETADPNAYGFRLKRSTHDAIEQCFKSLGRKRSATWVLEGDIKACFDKISIQWLLRNIPMDKVILKKFLTAGFMEDNRVYPTTEGTPQGGAISSTIALMALSGLERRLQSHRKRVSDKEKIHFIAYADDFIVTAASEALL